MIDEAAIRIQAERDGITHIATGVAAFRDGTLLVVRRVAHDDALAGAWELPGGGVDAGETITEGAARELREETGLEVDGIQSTFAGFDYTTPKKPRARQINFKVSVRPGEVRLSAEHDAYRWIAATEIDGLGVNPVMRACLHRAFA